LESKGNFFNLNGVSRYKTQQLAPKRIKSEVVEFTAVAQSAAIKKIPMAVFLCMASSWIPNRLMTFAIAHTRDIAITLNRKLPKFSRINLPIWALKSSIPNIKIKIKFKVLNKPIFFRRTKKYFLF